MKNSKWIENLESWILRELGKRVRESEKIEWIIYQYIFISCNKDFFSLDTLWFDWSDRAWSGSYISFHIFLTHILYYLISSKFREHSVLTGSGTCLDNLTILIPPTLCSRVIKWVTRTCNSRKRPFFTSKFGSKCAFVAWNWVFPLWTI